MTSPLLALTGALTPGVLRTLHRVEDDNADDAGRKLEEKKKKT